MFLDRELWVCSIDRRKINGTGAKVIQKHFFVLPDFLNGPTSLKPIVTPLGHIVFAKGGQLAILKSDLVWAYKTVDDEVPVPD